MMSIAQVRSAGSAGNYYTDKDNYYVLGSMGERWAGIRRKVFPGRPVTAMPSACWHRIARRWPLCPGRAVQPGSVSGWLNWS